MSLSQRERVLRALLQHPRGLTQLAFDLPDVVDGGPPIKRVAARVNELRDQGHPIVNAGRLNKCVVYRHQDAGTREGHERLRRLAVLATPRAPSREPEPEPVQLDLGIAA